MREEIKNFLEIEQAGTSNMRNGYYQRNLDTQYGRIEGLLVPRGRNGEFQTQLFAPYQRHTGWLEEAIIKMYQSGMSTREIGKFIERILGNAYSPTTISHITDVVKEDIVKWHTRCFLQAKNAEKCKKKYIGLPAQDLRFQTGGRGRLDRGESVPQSIALSRKGQDVGVVNQAIH